MVVFRSRILTQHLRLEALRHEVAKNNSASSIIHHIAFYELRAGEVNIHVALLVCMVWFKIG